MKYVAKKLIKSYVSHEKYVFIIEVWPVRRVDKISGGVFNWGFDRF